MQGCGKPITEEGVTVNHGSKLKAGLNACKSNLNRNIWVLDLRKLNQKEREECLSLKG